MPIYEFVCQDCGHEFEFLADRRGASPPLPILFRSLGLCIRSGDRWRWHSQLRATHDDLIWEMRA